MFIFPRSLGSASWQREAAG